MRARFALKLCGIEFEKIEVDFKNKPQAMLDLSPKGTVPVLYFKDSGKIIDESLDIIYWALSQKSPSPLMINDEAKMLIEISDTDFKTHLYKYKYHTRHPDTDPAYHKRESEKFLTQLDKLLSQHSYLLTDEPSIADIAILPFVRQYSLIDSDAFQALPFPHLQKWLNHWLSNPIFKAIMEK